MATSFEEIVQVIVVAGLVLVTLRVFFVTHQGRKLGRLVRTRYPALWKKEHPMPWPLIMDQQYMGFLLQRKYRAIEEEELVSAYENLRSRLVRTMQFLVGWLAVATLLAVMVRYGFAI